MLNSPETDMCTVTFHPALQISRIQSSVFCKYKNWSIELDANINNNRLAGISMGVELAAEDCAAAPVSAVRATLLGTTSLILR
jgi:hypothetical protein